MCRLLHMLASAIDVHKARDLIVRHEARFFSSIQLRPGTPCLQSTGVSSKAGRPMEHARSKGVFFIFVFFKKKNYRNIFLVLGFTVLYTYRPAGGLPPGRWAVGTYM